VSQGDAAERLYREAIERLGRTRVRVELSRAHLLYGEWLRRARRRVDAREQLRTAHAMCVEMGLEAFAACAARELLATGERARKRTVETREDLTAQEPKSRHSPRDGLSNPEIGARLFISQRTIEFTSTRSSRSSASARGASSTVRRSGKRRRRPLAEIGRNSRVIRRGARHAGTMVDGCESEAMEPPAQRAYQTPNVTTCVG
jgi:hypothetical protein